MGLLISINGVDFEPYSRAENPSPLISRKDPSFKVQPVQRDFDHPEDIQKDTAAATTQAESRKKYEESAQKSSHHAVFAKDLMSEPVITLEESEDIESAVALLREQEIRHLPIVNSEQKLVGIISDRDIALNANGTKLSDIMETNIIAGQADTRLQEIAQVMADHRINSIPILDKERLPIGIVTSTDILRSVVKNPNIDLFI